MKGRGSHEVASGPSARLQSESKQAECATCIGNGAAPVAAHNSHESQNRQAAKHLHKQRNGCLVVEKAGLEECEAGQHTEHQHGGKHDPSFISVIKVRTAEVSAE